MSVHPPLLARSRSAALGSLSPQGVPRSLSQRIREASTPAFLRALLYAILAGSVLLLLLGEAALYEARDAVKIIGRDTAPSIIAAQKISADLADLDANTGNFLLGNKAHQMEAARIIELRRLDLTRTLIEASQNITFGEAEKRPVRTLFEGLGRYLEIYGELKYRQSAGDVAGAVTQYDAATRLMHESLLPAADQLDAANAQELNGKYKAQQNHSADAEAITGFAGAVLLALLVYTQVFLFKRTRRRVNPPLLGGSVLCAALACFLVADIAGSRSNLKTAKEDAFASIHALSKARSIAFDANGDETRFLLPGSMVRGYGQDFHTKVAKLATIPEPTKAMLQGTLPASFKGYFADELNNITFSGEQDAAINMAMLFGEYHRVDAQIRALEQAGKHAQAVDLCIGLGDKQSNATFDRFDKALLDVIALNQREFDLAIASATRSLAIAEYVDPLATLAMIALALLGMRPRLREYVA